MSWFPFGIASIFDFADDAFFSDDGTHMGVYFTEMSIIMKSEAGTKNYIKKYVVDYQFFLRREASKRMAFSSAVRPS